MSNPQNSQSDQPATPCVQWQNALDAVGGDEELLRSVTEILVAEAPRQVQALRAAVASDDPRQLRRIAHTLKGSLMHYGALTAVDLAEQIERIGQAGEVGGVNDLIENLDKAVADVVQALVDYLRSGSSPAT